jgi:heterodisulfide reductase subunit C
MTPANRPKVLLEGNMDLEFMDQVHAIPGGDAIKRCIQCGTCSGTCPVSWAMDASPRRIIAMVRAGMRDKVLSSNTIWTCASCYSCTARCPQEIKITDVMYILKRLAIREAREKSRPAQAFSEAFTDIVSKYGRNHEMKLMARFMLSTQPLASVGYAGVGWGLTRTGRLPLSVKPIKGIESLRRIIHKAQALGGES